MFKKLEKNFDQVYYRSSRRILQFRSLIVDSVNFEYSYRILKQKTFSSTRGAKEVMWSLRYYGIIIGVRMYDSMNREIRKKIFKNKRK